MKDVTFLVLIVALSVIATTPQKKESQREPETKQVILEVSPVNPGEPFQGQ